MSRAVLRKLHLLALSAVVCATQAPAVAAADLNFSCQHYSSAGQMKKSKPKVDLTLVQHDGGASWTLAWADGKSATALPKAVQFGCMGRSTMLSWAEANKTQRAFLCYGDMHSDGDGEYFWLSVGHPSLFQPPGFGCSTAAVREKTEATR